MNTCSRRSLLVALAAVAACAVAAGSLAGAKEKAPPRPDGAPEQINEDEVLGEAYVKTRFPFVKFTFDDKKEWDNHEYIDGSKTLVIKGIERSGEHTLALSPREPGYEPLTLTIKPSDFRRVVVKTKGRTQTITFRAHYSADFKKVEAPKADKAPAEGAK